MAAAVIVLASEYRQLTLDRGLIAAVEQSDTQRALNLLAEGANARTCKGLGPRRSTWQTLLDLLRGTKQPEGDPALAMAVEHDNTDVATALAAHGARQVNWIVKSTDLESSEYHPLLLAAIGHKNLALAKLLLDHGADVRLEDEYRIGCVGYLAEIIPDKRVYVGAPNHFQRDSLLAFRMARLLEAHGVDLHQPDYKTDYLIGCAIDCQQTELFQYLLSERVCPREAQSALNGAVSTGSMRLVKQLMHLGARIPPTDREMESPMLFANDPAMVRFLVGQGMQVDAPRIQGHDWVETRLQSAAAEGNLAVVQCLTRCGANVNVKSDWGKSPLIQAAIGGHTDVARYLIAHGARVNSLSDRDMTALDYAIQNGNDETEGLLRRHGGRSGFQNR
jgi:hypothetical protein